MELIDVMKKRRSIRKYQDEQISMDDLNSVIDAGLLAPNAGGGQRTIIVGVHNKELTEKIGKLNLSLFDRHNLAGSYVSKEQPSNIDDPSINNGFYGAPSVCIVFAPRNFLYSIPDAFCCAENMVLQATNIGLSSCIIARGEETFESEIGGKLLAEWNIPDAYLARCFVILGKCLGDYPKAKPLKAGRKILID